MIKLLASNRPDGTQSSRGAASTQPLQATPHKVSVRNLPLPLSGHGAAANQTPAQSSTAVPRLSQPDPVAARAIAQFTEGQVHPIASDGQETPVGGAVTIPETPAVLAAAQLAAGSKSQQLMAMLTSDLPGRIKSSVSGLFKSHDAAIRTAVVLSIACTIAFAIAMA
ncbi:MAG: hypothetical protein JXQ99_18975 [Hyphomicrobiaceae bacterium]